jgi:hypothetical protein
MWWGIATGQFWEPGLGSPPPESRSADSCQIGVEPQIAITGHGAPGPQER